MWEAWQKIRLIAVLALLAGTFILANSRPPPGSVDIGRAIPGVFGGGSSMAAQFGGFDSRQIRRAAFILVGIGCVGWSLSIVLKGRLERENIKKLEQRKNSTETKKG